MSEKIPEIKCAYKRLVPIKELKAHPKNRNNHPPTQIAQFAKILDFQGIRRPVRVSKLSGFVTVGHGLILAAKCNGYTHLPVDDQDYDNEDMEYADIVADNAIALQAQLDFAKINLDIPDLGPMDTDLLGLKDFKIDIADKYADKDADAVPEARKTEIKLGDLFQLGNHRLLCGDSTDKSQVERLMNGDKADMVFTDPPYNIAEKCDGVAQGAPTNKQSKKLMESEWDKGFKFGPVSKSLESLLAEDCTVYVSTSQYVAPEIWEWMDNFLDYSGYCVWTKPNPFPSLMKRRWAFCTELVCYGTRGKQIFNYPKEGNALSAWNIAIGEGGLHPTQKPIAVPEHAIKHSSNSGQIVTDLFLGSGSTLIACEKTNRRCFGMEIDPQYCQVIIDRWEKFTGKKAEKLN
jgi:DNA modification methylase